MASREAVLDPALAIPTSPGEEHNGRCNNVRALAIAVAVVVMVAAVAETQVAVVGAIVVVAHSEVEHMQEIVQVQFVRPTFECHEGRSGRSWRDGKVIGGADNCSFPGRCVAHVIVRQGRVRGRG